MGLPLDFLDRIIYTLAGSFPGMPAYVVGGTVRDMLVGRPTCDFDLAVGGDVRPVAEELAVELRGTAFLMDPDRDVWRVTVRSPSAQIDLSPLKGDIDSDLAGRDFTVNAMAVGLAGADGVADVIDPYGGRDDIRARVIRALGREALIEDPLRMVRAFRLAAQLGFVVEEGTLAYVRGLTSGIASVSAERVRDELYLVLEGAGAADVFTAMHGAGLLRAVLPESVPMDGMAQSEPHDADVLRHSFAAMRHAESVMAGVGRWFGGRGGDVGRSLEARVDGGLTVRGLVKLCAFLHDVGKPSRMTEEDGRIRFLGHEEAGAEINRALAVRLKLSEKAARTLAATARGHMRPLHMTRGAPSRRAFYRYVRDMGEDLPASLIVAIADAMATRERPGPVPTDVEGLAAELAEYYFGEYRAAKAEPLLTGRDLVDVFGLVPGPEFRDILEDVEEKRAEGAIRDREGALRYVNGLVS